jgi:hypothetical protein
MWVSALKSATLALKCTFPAVEELLGRVLNYNTMERVLEYGAMERVLKYNTMGRILNNYTMVRVLK